MRTILALAAALSVMSLAPAAHAADCTIDQVGKRYNAQVVITYPSGRELAFSGGPGLHTNLDGTGSSVKIHGPWFDVITIAGCDNIPAVTDAINEMQRNYNQCVGVHRAGTFSGQDRAIECAADAG